MFFTPNSYLFHHGLLGVVCYGLVTNLISSTSFTIIKILYHINEFFVFLGTLMFVFLCSSIVLILVMCFFLSRFAGQPPTEEDDEDIL